VQIIISVGAEQLLCELWLAEGREGWEIIIPAHFITTNGAQRIFIEERVPSLRV